MSVGIWRKGCACLSWSIVAGVGGGGLVQQKRGREKDGKREGAMFVVGNPLERGNTRVHAHIHTPIYTHTGAKT